MASYLKSGSHRLKLLLAGFLDLSRR